MLRRGAERDRLRLSARHAGKQRRAPKQPCSGAKVFPGWIIVGVGIVVTCVGMGTMMSLSVFLQPMSQATGWSRTGISIAALLNFLFMGFGAILWGALSDRIGARIVVLCGGILLGAGLAAASQAATLTEFQIVFGVSVGLAAGSFYVPLTAMTTRWFTRNRSLAVALVSAGLGLGSTVIAPLARWIITNHDWRYALLTLAVIAWAVILPSALLLRKPPPAPRDTVVAAGGAAADMCFRHCAHRGSPPSRWHSSCAALHIRGRSSTWSPTRSIAACRTWRRRRCSASPASPR
jgi:MFS family permease